MIGLKGNRYKCWHGIGNDNYNVENILPGSEKTDSNKDAAWVERSVATIESCQNCKFRYLCGTGCPAAGHTSKEHFDLTRSYCVDFAGVMDAIAKTQFYVD